MIAVQTKEELLAELLKEAEETLKLGETILIKEGKVLKFSEWLTIADYAKKYNITTQIISKWIERGVIPDHGYIDIPEIGKKLVRDVPYRDTGKH